MYQKMAGGMIMPQSRLQTFLASTICREKMTQKLICEKCIIFSVCGSDPYDFDSVTIKSNYFVDSSLYGGDYHVSIISVFVLMENMAILCTSNIMY
jgi:hypothetical protein